MREDEPSPHRPVGPTRTVRPMLAALAVTAIACGGGDEATSLGADLNRDEARSLADLFADQASTVLEAHAEEAPDPDSPLDLSDEVLFSRGAACPGGGSVTVAGRVARESAEDEPSMTLDFSLSLVHDSCEITGGDRRIVVTGAPGISGEAHYEKTSQGLDGPQTASVEGNLRWSASDGESGRCEVAIETTLDPAPGTLHVSGSVCGVDVDDLVQRG